MEYTDDDDDFSLNNAVAAPGEFHGVYLLYCTNPQFKGRTYIGYTVNPNRRINQHNGGIIKGGAWKTSGRGPWEMVLITHGFPNDISALRFEWAWQHPKSTRRLMKVPVKSRGENSFQYCIRILSELLTVGPWNRLPLTIQWLKQQYLVPFPISRQPPLHMSIAYGPIATAKAKKAKKDQDERADSPNKAITCSICGTDEKEISKLACCTNKDCTFEGCVTCLATTFLAKDSNSVGFVIPVKGNCPMCGIEGLWSDFLKRKWTKTQKKSNSEAENDDSNDTESSKNT